MLGQMIFPLKTVLPDPSTKTPLRTFWTVEFVRGEMDFHVPVEVVGAGELAGAAGVHADEGGS